MSERDPEAKGRRLLTSVERLVASNDAIRELVAVCQTKARQRGSGKSPEALRELAAAEVVRTYSNRTAVAGGISSVPALLPGIGTVVASTAGALAELAYLLKAEVELCLALAHLYGFDIETPRERQLAFLAASVGTYDASGGSFVGDVVKAEGVAIWNYGPRAVTRLLVQVMTALALIQLGRGLVKAIPIVGIIVGSSMNKVLTRRVGDRAARDLRTRRDLLAEEPIQPSVKRAGRKPKRKHKPRADDGGETPRGSAE